MKILVRILAVIGALAIILVLVAAVGLWSLSRPSDQAAPAPAPNASAPADGQAPTDLQEGHFWAQNGRFESDRLVTSSGDLVDVTGTAQGLRTRQGGVDVGRLAAQLTLPFATVAEQVEQNVRLEHDGQGRVRVTTEVSALGRTLPVSAVGTVRADGGDIVVEPETVQVPGPDLVDAAVSAIARAAVTIREPVPGLPPGLAVQQIQVRDDGFRVHLDGSNVTLTQ